MSSTDTNLTVVNSMTEAYMETLKNSSGKIPSMANQIIITDEEESGGSDEPEVVNPFPINSIYMSVDSTSPASLFGGTWERIKDKFLLSAGDTYSAGSIGGESTHTLTSDEMPSHTHTLQSVTDTGFYRWGTNAGGAATYVGPVGGTSVYNAGYGIMWNGNTGGGGAHNNMPPYLTVYVWKRTA